MAKLDPTSRSHAAVKRTSEQLGIVTEGEISGAEAAEILGVSLPHLIGLLDAGRLPHRKRSEQPNAHRYVKIDDVLDYRRRRAKAQTMMDQYGAISEALGV